MVRGWGLVGFDMVMVCAKFWGCGAFIYGVVLVTVTTTTLFGGA